LYCGITHVGKELINGCESQVFGSKYYQTRQQIDRRNAYPSSAAASNTPMAIDRWPKDRRRGFSRQAIGEYISGGF
jgi:hypothetical protein